MNAEEQHQRREERRAQLVRGDRPRRIRVHALGQSGASPEQQRSGELRGRSQTGADAPQRHAAHEHRRPLGRAEAETGEAVEADERRLVHLVGQ